VKDDILGFCFQQFHIFGNGMFFIQFFLYFADSQLKLILINGFGDIEINAVLYGCLGICKIGITAQYDKSALEAPFPGHSY